jgi:CelD/BcsL family acetyltransferase involved in cellulose biosynthesis
VGELDGVPVGIALVTASLPIPVEGIRFRGIVHIGTAGEPRGQSVDVEYNRLLCEPAWRIGFAAALVEAIRDDLKPAAIRLDGFVPEDAALLTAAEPRFAVEPLACPAFDLGTARDTGGDVLTLLGSGVRSRIRRSDRGFGTLLGEWATTRDEALGIFDELIGLHQARWEREGRKGAFASARFTGFHRDFIARSMGDRPRVLLYRLRNEAGTIGCLYSFIEDGMVLFYQSGFIDVEDNRLKPGLSTHAMCMQECLARGLETYNFLAGEARYKRELATTELALQSAIGYRHRQTAALVDFTRRVGLVERARAVKRWRERRGVRRGQSGEQSDASPAT